MVVDQPLGDRGAALAWTIRVSVDALLLSGAAWYLTSLPLQAFVSAKVIQTAAFLCLFAGVLLAIDSLPLVIWLRLLGVGFVTVPTGVLVWHYIIDGKDRDQIVSLLSQRV